MDKRISDILNDLIAIDPQFKAHEQELRSVVSALILSKPETNFDESFAAKLRAELLEIEAKPMPSPYTRFFMSRMFYGVVGSALTILVVVPFTYFATQKATSPDKPIVINPFSDQVKDLSTVLTPEQQISNKGMNAFGKLALVPTSDNQSTSATPNTFAAKSAATTNIPGTASAPSTKSSVSSASVEASVTYTGDSISLNDNQGKVFKRTKGADSGKQLFDMVQKGKFGLTDLTSFSDLRLRNVQLSQDKPFGYVVGINLDEGAISITPQWEFWNTSNSTDKVATSTSLDDGSLISIANDFMKSHGIANAVYANPIARADSNTVIYPLKIDSKEVREEDGGAFGLVVTIDPAQKKVIDVSNLTSQTYESSLYSLETNFQTIVGVATSSLAAHNRHADGATLGTPHQVLMHYWLEDSTTHVRTELFIPALSFPITYKDAKTASSAIVVPLVKDFLYKK